MSIDAGEVADALSAFLQPRSLRFAQAWRRESQLLEVGGLMLAARHYEVAGYTVLPANAGGGVFKVKLGSRGYPWNFSWWIAERDGERFEIHANLAVQGAYGRDGGVYVVDSAVISRSITRPRRPRDWDSLPNEDLVTFLEAKRIVIYPMLVAQFIGIVHELKPRFLGGRRPRNFVRAGHFEPALVSIGYLHGRARSIVNGFAERRYRLCVVPNSVIALMRLRSDPNLTALDGRWQM